MARPWRAALAAFLDDPPVPRRHLTGALVCGSFITGHPSPRSDLDLHLVLAPGTRWRERGNRVIQGVMIEYFANPPAQIRKYFRNDHTSGGRSAATQFVTGRVLSDERGEVRRLVAEARRWQRRPFPPVTAVWVEQTKYGLFDALDNLEDALEAGRPDAAFLYFSLIEQVAGAHARFAREPAPSTTKLYRVLTSARERRKILADLPADRRHASLLAAALRQRTVNSMGSHATRLVRHTLERMGGFKVDGWRLRTPA